MVSERVIGVDLGGTKILVGRVARDGTIEARREYPTPTASEAELLAGLDTAIEDLLDDDVVALGLGIPSRIDQRAGRVVGSVNIPLGDLDFRDRMEQRLELPVGIENDANAATLAEFAAGAGRGARTMVMLTLGTGCGGGVVLDGQLYRGWAEVGHTVVEYDGLRCQGSCTGRGHLEAYVTGTAATRLAREAFGPAADSHRLVRLADEGDATAIELLAGMGRYLGAGIASLANLFDPDVVVIGGGFSVAADYLFPAALEVLARDSFAPSSGERRLVRAELGTAAGLVGAGLIAFAALPEPARLR